MCYICEYWFDSSFFLLVFYLIRNRSNYQFSRLKKIPIIICVSARSLFEYKMLISLRIEKQQLLFVSLKMLLNRYLYQQLGSLRREVLLDSYEKGYRFDCRK